MIVSYSQRNGGLEDSGNCKLGAEDVGFSESIKICLGKYLDFNGRASRSEYWWFVLLTFLIRFIPIIGWIAGLALILPSLSAQVRRLHDMDRSAWWLLLLVPPITIIGWIVLLIMSIFPGTPGPNRYGPNPVTQQQGTGAFVSVPPEQPYTPPPPTSGPGESFLEAPPPDPDSEGRQFCTQCGMQLPENARFCTECGAAL